MLYRHLHMSDYNQSQAKVYKTLAGGVGVPFVRWFGRECDYNAMVSWNYPNQFQAPLTHLYQGH